MRKTVAVLALIAAVMLGGPAHAQDFPTKAVKLIVPVAPGGGTDILARVMADRLQEIWNQPVIVDNRPGAGHIVGTTALSQSAADGYTLGMMGMPHVVNPALQPLPYKALDFVPIAMLAHIPVVAVVNPSVPASNMAELIALAKAKPGTINFAATSTNGAGHLAGELLKMRAGIDITFVPYKGSAPALQDLLAGRTQLMFDALLTAEPYIKSGQLRPIAVTTLKRVDALPSVGTMVEAGFPDFNVTAWLGLLAPSGTPAPIAEKISKSVALALRTPAVAGKLHEQGWTVLPMGDDPKVFASYLQSELGVWAGVVKAENLQP